MNNKILLLSICIIYILILVRCLSKQGFSDKQAKEIYDNKEMFKPDGKYKTAKYKINWLDPVIYTDLRNLYRKNQFSIKKIKSI